MYRRIYVLFGISILGVVLSHGLAHGLWALYAWTPQYQDMLPAYYDPFITPQWFILILFKQALVFCVPAFFFAAGYFVSFSIDESTGNITRNTIKARAINLLIPYSIWTMVTFIENIVLGKISTSTDFILLILGLNGFWFIPALLIFYIFSRWIISVARSNWRRLLLLSGLLQVFLIILRYTVFVHIKNTTLNYILSDRFENLFISYLFFFSFGVAFKMFLPDFKVLLLQYKKPILVSCILFLAICLYIAGWTRALIDLKDDLPNLLIQVFSNLYSMFLLLTFLAYQNVRIPLEKHLFSLGNKTLGIYFTHFYFMTIFAKIIYHIYPYLLYYQLLFTIITIIIGLGSSLLIIKMFKGQPFRAVYRYLFV